MGSRVLIVDDHPGFRAQARRLLESEGFEVVGEAEDAATGLQAARALAPELALVDVYLPDCDGFDLTEKITAFADPPAVVLISSRNGSEMDRCAYESGARGFVPKSELSRQVLEELLE
jgi:DNA-binding NarL/FixJ family response regulator